jgi:hypothetical protein
MFTVVAFVLAAGGVFISIFFACREESDNTRRI